MPVKFEVLFKSGQQIYYSGQLLSGEVRLSVNKPKRVKSITVLIRGSGRVSWSSYSTVISGTGNKIENVEHSGNEEYINCRSYTFSADNGSFFELAASDHVYKFNYMLPVWLPSSFEGTHGYIRYAVDIILERPWKFDCTFKKPFSVCRMLDLNRDASLQLPSKMELRKEYYLPGQQASSRVRGFFQITLNLTRSGYMFNETVPIEVDVINCCGFSLNRLVVSLRKNIMYTCEFPEVDTKVECVDINQLSVDCLLENDRKSFLARIEIPFTPPTTLTFCKVIHIEYEVKVEAVVPGLNANPCVSIPITIGTVPHSQLPPDQLLVEGPSSNRMLLGNKAESRKYHLEMFEIPHFKLFPSNT